MKTLDLSTQTNLQLEILVAEEEQLIKSINNILTKIDEVCIKEMGMNLEKLYEAADWAIDRLNTLKSEIEYRKSNI